MWTKVKPQIQTLGGTAVPHKTTISRNISAEFQEMLPDIQIHAIHKRKKKP